MDALTELAIGIAVGASGAARHDLAIGEETRAPLEDVLQGQRKIHRRAAHLGAPSISCQWSLTVQRRRHAAHRALRPRWAVAAGPARPTHKRSCRPGWLPAPRGAKTPFGPARWGWADRGALRTPE